MRQGLVRVERPYKGGTPRFRWQRPAGACSPSREPEYQRQHYNEVRIRALHAVGGLDLRCKCGYDDVRALQIDHVNGGGNAEFKAFPGAAFYYKVLRDLDKSKYQVLCANCNVIKRVERKECRRT